MNTIKEAAREAPTSVLQEAENAVNGPRQKDYGHPLDDFTRTAGMWSAYKGVTFTPEDVANMMIIVKLSRLHNSPTHRDSLIDIAGYVRCEEILQEERERRLMDETVIRVGTGVGLTVANPSKFGTITATPLKK